MTTQTPKYQAPYPKLYMDKVNVIRYGYDLLGNFDPVGRKEAVHHVRWGYITLKDHQGLDYLGHFWDELKNIYLEHYLPKRHRYHDWSLSKQEYNKLPKKYHNIFKERIGYLGKKTYEHPAKWKYNILNWQFIDRPQWTVILRNPADKEKYFDLCKKLELFWESEQVYHVYRYQDLETADALRSVFMQLAEITWVKYLKPLWKKERDFEPDYAYEEYKAEHDRKDVMVRMMKEKRKREAELYEEYQARKLWMFEKLQEKFNVGKHR